MLMFLSSFVLAENDETGFEEVEQVDSVSSICQMTCCKPPVHLPTLYGPGLLYQPEDIHCRQ